MIQGEDPRAPHKRRSAAIGIALLVLAVVVVALLIFVLVYKRPTVVPNVRLMSTGEAEYTLENAGLALGHTSEVATSAVGAGLVAGQSPAAATKVARTSNIDVSVAVAPTLAKVPDVIGLTIEQADQKLAEALYLPRRVDVFDAKAEPGTVVGQFPTGGSQWLTGNPVALGVSAGPNDGNAVAIPDVIGMVLPHASDTLQELGLVATAIFENPNALQTSPVVEQVPTAGVLVRPGTTVLLFADSP